MEATAIAEKAAGSKELRRAAVLGSTLSGGAVMTALVTKLSADQVVYLLERMGGYLILCLVLGAVIYRVGNRMGSAIFQHANTNIEVAKSLGGVSAGMGLVSHSLQNMAVKDDERALIVESTLNHVAGEAATTGKLVQHMYLKQGEQDAKIDSILDFMNTMSERLKVKS